MVLLQIMYFRKNNEVSPISANDNLFLKQAKVIEELYENGESSKNKIKQVDKQRAEYYKHFTSQTWGDRNNYDLCIDTSKTGVVQAIDVLEGYVKKRIN